MNERALHMSASSNNLLVSITVILASLLFGANAIVLNLLDRAGISVWLVNLIRIAGTALLLNLIVCLARPEGGSSKERKRSLVVTQGIVGFFVVPSAYLIAITRLPVSTAIFIEFTAPLYVALTYRFVMRKPVHGQIWLGLLIGIPGLWLLVQPTVGSLDRIGLASALLAAVSLAAYYLLANRVGEGSATIRWTAEVFAVGTAPALVAAVLANRWLSLEYPNGAGVWLLSMWAIVLGTCAPYLMLNYALTRTSPERVATLSLIEPVAASVLGGLVLHQSVTLNEVVGGTSVLVAAALAQRSVVRAGR